jgi:hypothetical protein
MSSRFRKVDRSLIFGLVVGLLGASQLAIPITGGFATARPVAPAKASAAKGFPALSTLTAGWGTGRIRRVPASIDATGVADVTEALNAFLKSSPTNSTVVFPPNGRYRIEGTLSIRGKTDLVIDGNNSTFFATTNGLAGPPPPNCQGNGPCHPNRGRMQWNFQSDTDLYVHDTNVIGASTDSGVGGTYVVAYEAQHAYNIGSGHNVVLDHVTAKNTWGDLVYIGGGDSNKPATNVVVADSTLDGASRQCVTVVDASHVLIAHNSIGLHRGCTRSLFDFEANIPSSVITYVVIKDNRLGHSRFYTFNDAGAAATEHDITLDGNTMDRAIFGVNVEGFPQAHRSNYRIINNVGTNAHNQGSMHFEYVDGLVVSGNTQPYQPQNWPQRGYLGSQAPVWTNCSSNVSVRDNHFTPRPARMREYANHTSRC